MKKITFVIFAFLVSFVSFAQFPEGFEGTWTAGSGPSGWTIINAAGPIQTWQQLLGNTTYPAHSGSYAAFINRENVVTGTTEDWLITPQFTVPSNAQLKFWSMLTQDGDQGTIYKVFIGTNPANTSSFTEIANWTETTLATTTTYEQKTVNIPATYSGQQLYLAFVMYGDQGDRWLIDDVDVAGQCFVPTNLGVTNVSANTAGLTWTDAGGSGSWEIEYFPSTSTATGSGSQYSGQLPYPISGLTPSTNYTYYVRSVCQPAGNNSAWAGPFTFTTSQIPLQPTATIDFESASNFTIVNGTQTNKWTIGTAVSSSPSNSLYITNGNASATNAANTYSNTTSVVHAYRDVLIPAGAISMSFSYKWKGVGEDAWDYLSVWSTPTTFIPVAGTEISAVNANYIEHDTNLQNATAWTTQNYTLDVSAYQGTVRRFIFQWTNDGISRNQPPAAVDDITFTRITCPAPNGLTTTVINTTSADLAWTERGTATRWQVYVVPVAAAAPTSTTTGVTVDNTPAYNAPGLTPGTAYKYYVRSVCSDSDMSTWAGPFNFNTFLCEVPDRCTYTFTMTDSNGDGWNGNTMDVRQNGVTIATLSLATGSSATQTVTVCTNNPVTLFWNAGGTWPGEVGVSIANNFGQVVFSRASGTGAQNTSLYTGNVTCSTPACLPAVGLGVTGVTLDSATLTWTNVNTAVWEYYLVTAGSAAPTAASTGVQVSTNSAPAAGLTPSTSYTYYVRMVCNGGTSASVWSPGYTFTTTQIPATLNFNEDFESTYNWTATNGSQTNKWFYGTAVSDSPTHSLYISNNAAGTNNNYSGTASVVQVYRDIAVPVGYNDLEFTFRWRNQGETNNDYITAFVVPTSYMPVAGTNMINAVTGGSQLTARLSGSSSWTTYNGQINATAYAGSTMRLVFQWVNDGSVQNNPAGAIDNITLRYLQCPNPTGLTTTCLSSDGIALNWNATGSATQWEVAIQTAAQGVPTGGTVVNSADFTYQAPITPGTAYTAWVRAVCADGSGYSGWTTLNFTGPLVSVGSAQALCAGILAVPQQSNSGNTVPAYGTIGCLYTTPNPTWYYVTLGGDGAVSLNLSQVANGGTSGIDVDFAIFGPFTSKLDACSRLGSPPNTSYIVDCSYSSSAVEQIDFTGNTGDVFALLVTNYSNQPGQATITQTSGPSVSCNPTVELGQNRSICNASSYNLTASVDNPGQPQVYTYTWFKDTQPYTPTVVTTTASSQTIAVTDAGTHVYTVLVTMPNPTSSDPVTDTTTITLSHPYTAPVYTPIFVCSSTSTADVNININYLGSLDPAAYNLVGVYSTFANAAANANAINTTVPYTTGSTTLYAVVTDVLSPDCKKTIPLQITVNPVSATINYNATYCTSDAPAQSGLQQIGGAPGIYTVSPTAGLSINPTTGVITPGTSTPGVYHIEYTIASSGPDCPAVVAADDVEILLAPVATTIDYPGAYCNTAGTTAVVGIRGTTGGTFSGDAGLFIDPATGTVDLGASSPGLHTVTYVIPSNGSCSLPPVTAVIEINQQLSGTFDYPHTTYCTNEGTVNVTNFVGSINGSYIATPAGLSIDRVTGAIDLANSAANQYTIVYHFDATASCDAYTSPEIHITINAAPVTTVTYDGPYCNSAGLVGTPIVQGSTGGTFTGDSNLVINGTTGIIDLGASAAGPHTVTYTPPASTGPCTELPILIPIQINAQLTGTFDYPRAAFCTSEGLVNVTNFVGSTGGTFRANPSTLVIDATTGQIDLASTPAGVYNIDYHFDATASCAAYTSPAFQITVVEQPVTTITYGTAPFCNTAGFTAMPNIQGTQTGVFTSTPAGLAINATTGEIDLGTSTANTTYTVYFQPSATGPCTEPSVSAMVQINASLSATITYAGPYCSDDTSVVTPLIAGSNTGVFRVETNPGHLDINTTTGAINIANSDPGSYVITYFIASAGACGDFTSVPQTVVINQAPDHTTTLSYTASTFCSNAGIAAAQVTGTQGGTFSYVSVSGTGTLDINTATGEITTARSTQGDYDVYYTTPSGVAPCTPFTAPAFRVTINTVPVVLFSYTAPSYCQNGGFAVATLDPTSTTGGTFTSSTGLSINAATGQIDLANSTEGAYDVYYSVAGPAGCASPVRSLPVRVVITKTPSADFTYSNINVCNSVTQPVINPNFINGGVAGTFTVSSTTSGTLSIDSRGVITPGLSDPGVYTITNTVTGTDGCTGFNPTQTQIVTITNAPVANFTYNAAAFCKATTSTASPTPVGSLGRFTSTPAGLVIDATTGVINVAASTPGSYAVINTIAANASCTEIVSDAVPVIITAQPIITTTNGCDNNKYYLNAVLDNDPVYTADDVSVVWTDANGTQVGTGASIVITRAGVYTATVTPLNGGTCSVQSAPINVVSASCNIQRGISPGVSDHENDSFDLTGLDVRKISIYNRYGKEVYKFEGQYTNQWHGQTNDNADLPSGTYFYTFFRVNGESKTGWIYINREVK